MDCNLQGTGIVSRPPISPELYFKTIGKKVFIFLAVLPAQMRLPYHLRMDGCLQTISLGKESNNTFRAVDALLILS